MNYTEIFPKIIAHCKEHGFIFPSSEIYDGLSAVYDYGQLGAALKRNLRESWWKEMTQLHENIVGIDSAILMHPLVWKASGHIDAFNDPLIDNKDSKKRYRADQLIEDFLDKLLQKSIKETEKKAAKENWSPSDEAYQRFLKGNRDAQKHQVLLAKYTEAMQQNNMEALKNLIDEAGITDPETGSKNWTDIRQFNLMFKTQLGSMAETAQDLYLRPETAQGIFVNFLNVQKSSRLKVPFGIAQVGKSFRNEIVARQFIFRMREFEQMEMQFFIKPGTQHTWFNYWLNARFQWHISLGIEPQKLRFKPHEKLAHYADAATDIEFMFPFGFKELEGVHSRTDFDLSRHQEISGKKMAYFDPDDQTSFIPYVVETSAGLDRTVLTHLCNAYREEEVPTAEAGESALRTVLSFHPEVAPVKIAVFPLVKKDGLPEIATQIASELRKNHSVTYEEKDTIGRRYRRQDAKGTPFCITIDNQTHEDQKVTVRHRDSMLQERVATTQLETFFKNNLSSRKG